MSLSMQDKVAIVTGGSRGIGLAVAVELAQRGAKVALTYVSDSSKAKADAVVDQVEKIHQERGGSSGPVAVAIQADSASMEAPAKIVDGTLRAFGTNQIDMLVNNAGASQNMFLEDITEEHYDRQMDINVKGLIFLTQKVVPLMPRGQGRIVNLSSVSARTGYWSQTVYGASKAAVEGLTKVWATELGQKYGITVNCVNPGPVDTDMFSATEDSFEEMIFTKMPPVVENRKASPRDIADIVAFLCEEKSRWVSGDVVCANGGAMFT